MSEVCELTALRSTTLDGDGLATPRPVDEDAEHRVGAEAGPVGGPQAEGNRRQAAQMGRGDQDSLAAQLGDAVRVSGSVGWFSSTGSYCGSP